VTTRDNDVKWLTDGTTSETLILPATGCDQECDKHDSVSERIVNVWNGLPPSVSFASLSTFRRTIQKVDFSQFMKCT